MSNQDMLKKKIKNTSDNKEIKGEKIKKEKNKNVSEELPKTSEIIKETKFFNEELGLREELQKNEDEDVKKISNNQYKWINRQRVLVIASRGISHSERILMNNIISLLPHSKKEVKIERKIAYTDLNEICFNHSCSNAIYFEHKKRELVMWVFRSPDGPTLKFQINNISSLDEPKMHGNCLKYSRPIINFDSSFNNDSSPHLGLIKEMLFNSFNTPRNHPKSKPFHDHIINFYNINNTIFFRNYQIVNDLKEKFRNEDETNKLQLIEIGPRFSMTLIKIFDGVMGGKLLYQNDSYVSPGELIKRNNLAFKERQRKLMKEEEELNEKTKNKIDVATRFLDEDM